MRPDERADLTQLIVAFRYLCERAYDIQVKCTKTVWVSIIYVFSRFDMRHDNVCSSSSC